MFAVLSVLLAVTFIWALPQWFAAQDSGAHVSENTHNDDASLVTELSVETAVDVEPGPDLSQEATTVVEEDHAHTRDHHAAENTLTQKLMLALISIIATGLLSLYVYRKIQVKGA